MCGIIGQAGSLSAEDRVWLVAGRDTMRHRGPDDFGEWWSKDGLAGLGHRRLSIIDLSPAGHQPMSDLNGDLEIVFNGEIYNFIDLRRELAAKGHAFRSDSDTEVILAAFREWGEGCVSHLNGMFALGIYDGRTRRLLLARDRAGEKPLFYRVHAGTLRFASELKALMADPRMVRRIDAVALDCYLAMGFVPGEQCILDGVRKLPPAHALVFDAVSGASRQWRYWQMPAAVVRQAPNPVHDELLLNRLDALLEDAVRRQLVADVAVGVLLSGGVDSSLVTAMAARTASRVKTFTVRFPGHGHYDETEHARLIARHFGTEHVELEPGEPKVDLLPMLARQFDEPMVDSSMIPTYLLSRLVREHCTVALGGDGGDELFGGYAHYNRMLWVQDNLGWVPRRLKMVIGRTAGALLPVGFRGRNWLQGLESDSDEGLAAVAACFDSRTRRRLMSVPLPPVGEQIRKRRIPGAASLLETATRMDFKNYLPEDILVKVDRASMLNSLEVRAPLLDYRLIEFAFGEVPAHLKATSTTRKVLLKKLAARVLPQQFDLDRKQGFSIPLAAWLESGPWLKFFREVLLDGNSTVFDRRVVEGLLAGQGKKRNNSERLFALVLLELWRREYRVAI